MKKLLFGYKILFISILAPISHDVLGQDNFSCALENAIVLFSQQKLVESEALLRACFKDQAKLDEENLSPDVYFYLGLIERSRKHLPSAQAYFQKAIKQTPKIFYRLEYAVSLEWDQKLDAAKNQYDFILKNDILNKFALHGKARILRWQRHLDESKTIYKQLLAMNSNDINAQLGLGFIELMDKNYKRSRKIFEIALAKQPDNNEAILGLKQLGDLKKHALNYAVETKNKSSDLVSNQKTVKHSFRIRSEFNNKLTGLYRVEIQDRVSDGLELTRDGLSINREAEYKLSAHTLYDDLKTKYLFGIDIKRNFSKDYEYQLTLQAEKGLKNNQRWYAGIRPTIVDTDIENTLIYSGHFKEISQKLNLHNQVFYVLDPKQKNSYALVSSLKYMQTTKISSSLGVSYSVNPNGKEKVMHANIAFRMKDNFDLSLNAVKMLNKKSNEITLRMNYRF